MQYLLILLFSFFPLILQASDQQQQEQQQQQQQQPIQCFQNLKLSTPEITITSEIQKLIASKAEIHTDCLLFLINRGYFRSALELYESYFLMRRINLFDIVRSHSSQKKKELDQFIGSVLSKNTQVQRIKPVLQWAQSADKVFIQVKLAMRLDSPACLNCKLENITIKNNSIQLNSFGIVSHQPLRWHLKLKLEGMVDLNESYYKMEAVGTIFFNLSKQEKGKLWKQLEIKQKKKYPIWWDMRDKYKQDMDNWIQMLEEEELENAQDKKNSRKKQKEEKLLKNNLMNQTQNASSNDTQGQMNSQPQDQQQVQQPQDTQQNKDQTKQEQQVQDSTTLPESSGDVSQAIKTDSVQTSGEQKKVDL